MKKLSSNKNIIVSSGSEVKLLKVTTNMSLPSVLRKDKMLVLEEAEDIAATEFDGYGMVVSKKPTSFDGIGTLTPDLHYLADGDVVRVVPSRNDIRAIFRIDAPSNFLFVTERCNSFCLMCSQPPRDVADDYLVDELMQAVPLMDRGTRELGITGGEPTLLGEEFFELVKHVRNYLPETSLHILSNGRTFSDPEMAARLARIKHPDLMVGIPLYSDISELHDYVVQADGAYDQTLRGILNLKRCSVGVEIRIVLHKQTTERLPALAEFIGRNLQFVDHVALMGLEITGFTRANLDELWIDPVEYQAQLLDAVDILRRYKMNVSIYNLQRCLIDQRLWDYSVKSISDWKNKFYKECEGCGQRSECGGFFASSDIKRSDYVHALP